MGVFLLTDQHDCELLALRPFEESGLIPVGSPAPLSMPGGLCLDKEGNLIVADSGNHCLVIRDLWSATWRSYGVHGAGQGELFAPSDVATNSTNSVFVVDAGNRRLVRMDDLAGMAWLAHGTAGRPSAADPAAVGKFAEPRCLALDGRDRVCVTDPGANRAVRLDAVLIGTGWGVLPLPAGANPVQPWGIAAGNDRVAVSDVGNRKVHVFDLDDNLIATLDGLAAGIAVPAYLAYDGEYLVVADIVSNELRRFRLTGGTFVFEGVVRGSGPTRITPLFQQIGGIASGVH